jgi:tetratricopeptide (TPR) repeat protein
MAFCIIFLLPEEALSDELPQPSVSGPTGGLSSSEDSRLALSRAWKYFDSEKFDHSARFFRLAGEYPENRFEARFGLGLSYMKLGRKEDAIEEFSFLIENDYKKEEVLPPMMWLLLDIKDYERAGQYLPLVKEGKQKRQWRKMIGSGPFTLEAETAIKNNDPEAIISAVNKYKHLLASCSAPYTFFNSSRVLAENEIKTLAREIYADLL